MSPKKLICSMLLASMVLMGKIAIAQVPQQMNYQCILTDGSGNLLTGNFSVVFSIYSVATGGTALYSETQTVSVNNGLCNVILGSVTPIPLTLFDATPRYLGIKVNTDPEMTPRQIISSVAYAFRAQSVVSGGGSTLWTASGSNIFYNSGNVGVGTTSPTDLLTIDIENSPGPRMGGLTVRDGFGNNVAALTDNTTGSSTSGVLHLYRNGTANISLHSFPSFPSYINAGNVGIGTTSPTEKLDVVGNIKASGTITSGSSITIDGATDKITASSGKIDFDNENLVTTGTVGVGKNPNPGVQLHVFKPGTGDALAQIQSDVGGGTALLRLNRGSATPWDIGYDNTDFRFIFRSAPNIDAMTLKSNGNVGIGTTGPTAQFHTTGTVRFANFGAGTLQTDASGNVSVSSDIRLKNVKGDFERGLSEILSLKPINYTWNEKSGLDTKNTYSGFSAQNVQEVIPEAVSTDQNDYLTLSDRPIIAALVNAVKELSVENEQLKAKISELEGMKAKMAQFELTLQKLAVGTKNEKHSNGTVSSGADAGDID